MMYIHKHRQYLADASRLNKIHHLKEVAIRVGLGYAIGAAACFFLFGLKS